jgi:hypothetical protein
LWLRKKKKIRRGNYKQRLEEAGEVVGGAPLLNEQNKVWFLYEKIERIFKYL